MSYPTSSPAILQAQPSIEQPYTAKQPSAKATMNAKSVNPEESKQQEETMRLRGGCPGHFCGLPILPCRCDICIIPIPCC
ncbi:uncharacterized protein L201_000438 [Kwoniella dendrophila CBS 6074]|uniref:Cysteine-rich transmembrane CYSTM domain-containing protein n=1 Tax=Kwoniella dendrophila CBS 6074 TaxID=1295534 RepID=A0AAX4JJH0_9TREE